MAEARSLGVVVPTIGDRDELRRLLRSVGNQTRAPESVCVVVDSTETELVEQILDELRDELGTIELGFVSTGVQRGEGEYLVETGYGYAVNAGLAELDTDFVAFLDDDDEILPNHFANLETALTARDDIGLAYSRVEVVSVDGRRRNFQSGDLPSGRFSAFTLIGAHPVLLPATLIRRSLVDRLEGLDTTFDRKADTDMLVRLGQASEFVSVGEATYVYYRNPHGSEVNVRALEEMHNLIAKHQATMTRKERWLSWDALTRSSSRAGLDELSRKAAGQAVATWVSTQPRWLVSLYVRIRRLDTPKSLRRCVRNLKGGGKS
jgi:glycosyltransferase involved in cell wall biosynthesis